MKQVSYKGTVVCAQRRKRRRFPEDFPCRLFSQAVCKSVSNLICSGIEVVITGLTRNQFASNRTRVRIPPAAPKSPVNMRVCWTFLFCLLGEATPKSWKEQPVLWREKSGFLTFPSIRTLRSARPAVVRNFGLFAAEIYRFRQEHSVIF